MSYVDYDYYRQEYGGERIPAESFARYSRIASAMANLLTMLRLRPEQANQTVKDALCVVAEMLFGEDARGNVHSESNDGYSITFEESKEVQKRAQEVLAAALLPTGLLHRGMGV